MFEIRIFLRCRRCYADGICYISITVNIIHSQMENLFKRTLAAFLDSASILYYFFFLLSNPTTNHIFHLCSYLFQILAKSFSIRKRKKNIIIKIKRKCALQLTDELLFSMVGRGAWRTRRLRIFSFRRFICGDSS